MGDIVSSAGCCSGRDEYDMKRRVREKIDSGGALVDDATIFDRAYDTGDTRVFVELLSSYQPIEQVEERMHPWAADPQTIGALSATQLAILAAREREPELKDAIREAKAIPPLVRFLDSREEDRVHAATVALALLAVDNRENCLQMLEHGAMRPLIKGMCSSIDGMRAACAQTCRNLYVIEMRYRHEFERLGGVKALMGLLDLIDSDDPSPIYTRIEALYHIEDLIYVNGTISQELKRAVVNAGVVSALEKIVELDDPSVAQRANKLLSFFLQQEQNAEL